MTREIFEELDNYGLPRELIKDISELELDKNDFNKSIEQIMNIIDKIKK